MVQSATLSLLVWCKRDNVTKALQLQIVDVNTAQDVVLKESSFLLRIASDEQTGITRCFVRHIASGREAYVQGGPRLREFVAECLLDDVRPDADPPSTTVTTGA